jgi:hypothetical protein
MKTVESAFLDGKALMDGTLSLSKSIKRRPST